MECPSRPTTHRQIRTWLKWKDATGADFNIEIAWTQGYADQGAAYLDRVRDLAAQDPSCHAGSCSAASWSHWYQHRAQPYFGGAESTVSDFDPRSGTPVALRHGRAGQEGTSSNVVVRLDAKIGTGVYWAMLHRDGDVIGTFQWPGGPDGPVRPPGGGTSYAARRITVSVG